MLRIMTWPNFQPRASLWKRENEKKIKIIFVPIFYACDFICCGHGQVPETLHCWIDSTKNNLTLALIHVKKKKIAPFFVSIRILNKTSKESFSRIFFANQYKSEVINFQLIIFCFLVWLFSKKSRFRKSSEIKRV